MFSDNTLLVDDISKDQELGVVLLCFRDLSSATHRGNMITVI